MIFLEILKWILIILGVILLLIGIVLWSTITIDVAANGNKMIVTARLWHFLHYTLTLPTDKEDDYEDESEDDSVDDDISSEKYFDNKNNKLEKNDDMIYNGADDKVSSKKNEPEDELTNDNNNETEKKEKSVFSRFNLFKKSKSNEEKGGFSEEVKNLWDNETKTFDFEEFHRLIIKYCELIDSAKYGIMLFFRLLKHKIRVSRLDVYIRYGTGQPEKTGVLYGSMYGFMGALTPLMKNYIKMKNSPRLFLDPDYVNSVFDFEVGSIIKTRIAHIINAAAIAFVAYRIRKNKGSA